MKGRMDSSDRELLMTLYDRYASLILALAYSKMPAQEAEDVLYSTIERLLPHLPRIAEFTEPQRKAYVYTAARSEVADRLRRRMREAKHAAGEVLPDSMPDPDADVERIALNRTEVETLRNALRLLPEDKRRLLEMRYVLEMDCAQIGRSLNMKPDAVRQQLLRLRRKIRQQMEEG